MSNDSEIVFIGGELHGQHRKVDSCDIYQNLIHPRVEVAIVSNSDISQRPISCKVELYERIKFAYCGRVFYAMVLKGTPLKDAIEFLEKLLYDRY